MDDIVVIILTLIFAFFGILGQARKKKAVQQNEKEEDKSDGFWGFLDPKENVETQNSEHEEMYQEMATGETAVPTNENKYHEKKPVKKAEYAFKASNEGASAYKGNLKETGKKRERKSRKKHGSFSLRKAVIYSEILNRKYH